VWEKQALLKRPVAGVARQSFLLGRTSIFNNAPEEVRASVFAMKQRRAGAAQRGATGASKLGEAKSRCGICRSISSTHFGNQHPDCGRATLQTLRVARHRLLTHDEARILLMDILLRT
jgi:hypothetical protein